MQIKHRFTAAVLWESEHKTIRLCLEAAVKANADLGSADLWNANLGNANLGSADLWNANLGNANLGSANLGNAKGISPERTTSLLMLLDQPGAIRAYKLVNSEGKGPFYGGIKYEIGGTYEVDNADTDANSQCGKGINLATLPWCLSLWREGYRILIAEFTAKDIATIPTATDGKFRVRRCKIIGEKEIDPVALGLVREAETEAAA